MMLIPLITKGAERVAETDPHGLTLTLISVAVVFSALIILYFIYSTSGNFFSGKYKFKRNKGNRGRMSDEVAAAIALALDAEQGTETEVAIALALHLHLSSETHDIEPGIVTIRHTQTSWKDKSLTFRKRQ